MMWGHKITNISVYERVSTNQHGDRYKERGTKDIRVARLESDCKNLIDMRTLILLSHELSVPVHYNFDDEIVYIEVVSAEAI